MARAEVIRNQDPGASFWFSTWVRDPGTWVSLCCCSRPQQGSMEQSVLARSPCLRVRCWRRRHASHQQGFTCWLCPRAALHWRWGWAAVGMAQVTRSPSPTQGSTLTALLQAPTTAQPWPLWAWGEHWAGGSSLYISLCALQITFSKKRKNKFTYFCWVTELLTITSNLETTGEVQKRKNFLIWPLSQMFTFCSKCSCFVLVSWKFFLYLFCCILFVSISKYSKILN